MSDAAAPVAGFDPALIVSTAGGNWRVAELGFAWIGALLDARPGDEGAATPEGLRVADARGAYDDARDRLRASGGVVAIDRMSAAFGLSPFEEDVCLLALAARVDEGLARRFGQVSGRAASCPPLHLAVDLLAVRSGEPAASAHLAFGPTEPLRRFGLIDADADAGLDVMSPLVLDESIARYLMGDEAVDPRAAASLMRVAGAPLAASQSALAESLAR
ncbi:hypothetical protein, partial [Hansschlegelia zhihuaiae]|uniref:hypothetical protein n=1 Tax=Hansschlegelia zhihuaiae TaxID=405005 RepID=UPI0019D45B77